MGKAGVKINLVYIMALVNVVKTQVRGERLTGMFF